MKNLLLLVVLFAVKLVHAQAPDYNDLTILYADGNYEKLVKVSEKYTVSEKTKGDALPYMWLGRALYKISLSGTDDEKFKTAYKESFTSIGKCIKLDKDKAVQEEFAEFFDEYKNSVVEAINNELAMPKKALSWIIKYYKINPVSVGAKYLEAACKFLDNDKTGANVLWKDADKKLSEVKDFETWSEAEKDLLRMGIAKTAECMVKMKQNEKAKALVMKVADWYGDDADFKEVYEKYVG
jgi:hypothetical protein